MPFLPHFQPPHCPTPSRWESFLLARGLGLQIDFSQLQNEQTSLVFPPRMFCERSQKNLLKNQSHLAAVQTVPGSSLDAWPGSKATNPESDVLPASLGSQTGANSSSSLGAGSIFPAWRDDCRAVEVSFSAGSCFAAPPLLHSACLRLDSPCGCLTGLQTFS